MLYLTSISMLLIVLLVVTALGRRITFFLPSTIRETSELFIAPLIGLAGLILITTVYGWLSPFKTNISFIIVAMLLFFGILFEKQRDTLFRDWLIISVFVIIATLPIFAPAIRFESFNPFNDTFTYLVHGQWLQEHAFSELVKASGHYPAETQVVLYQNAGHRMGGSFFLGFVQSLFNLEWSYYAYLPTVSIVFALGSLAIGGFIRQAVPTSKAICLVLSTLPAFSMNGFVFGAQHGFYPQTFGITFCAGLVCLIPALIGYIIEDKPKWTKQILVLFPLTIICSALLITYNDMFPAAGAGIGLFLLVVCVMNWREKMRILGSVCILAAQVLVVVNVEGIRILNNFLHTVLGAASGAVQFGWPVLWAPVQFVALSFGMKSPFGNSVFMTDKIISTWMFPVIFLGIIFMLIRILREKPKNFTIILLICINVVYWMAFLKFRYATPGFEGEVGHTFLQFKIAKWLALFNLGLIGIVMAWIFIKAERYKPICRYAFCALLVAGMALQYFTIAKMFINHFQDETMREHAPFNVFLELRSRVANISKDEVIYLGIPNDHHKVTQMVAYILSDRKLAGKYKDGYLRGSLPVDERDMPLDTADWMIQLKPIQTPNEDPLDRVGPFLIRQAPFSFYNLESIAGAYGTETGYKKTWNWVKDSVEYRFLSAGNTQRAKIKFSFLLSGPPRTLYLDLDSSSGKQLASFEIPMNGGWGEYESPVIETQSENIIVRLKADGEPNRLSAGDPRETKFLIQNLSLLSGSAILN